MNLIYFIQLMAFLVWCLAFINAVFKIFLRSISYRIYIY